MSEQNGGTTREDAQGEQWDRIIQPTGSLGPHPVGQLLRYQDLLWLLVRRDIVAFYKQTVFGPLWFVLQPLLLTGIYILVFGRIADLPTDGAPRILFYLCGISLWNYVNDCVTKSASTFKDNADLFGKVYFPRILLPLSIAVSSLVRLGIQFALFLIALAYFQFTRGGFINGWLVALPVVFANLVLISFSCGTLLAAMASKYRDLLLVLPFGLQLCMYATPIIYPVSAVPSSLAQLFQWNPLTHLFETARGGLLNAGSPSIAGLMYSTVFSIVLLVISVRVFHKIERTVVDSV